MSYNATKIKGSSIRFDFYRICEHVLTEPVSHKVFATFYVESPSDVTVFREDLFSLKEIISLMARILSVFLSGYTGPPEGCALCSSSSSGMSHLRVQFSFAPISTRTCCPRNNQTSVELAYAQRKGYCSSKCHTTHCNDPACESWNGRKQQILGVLIQFPSFCLCLRRPCIFSWPMLLTAFWELPILLKSLSVKSLSLCRFFFTKWWNFEM